MQEKLNKSTIFYYGQLALPLAMIGLPLYIYIPTFYNSSVGISAIYVGVILFFARVTDVFTDPFFGYISDRCVQKYGNRKPLMFMGFFIVIISFYALINPLLTIKELWLLFFTILIYIGWSMVTIPYLTWSAEISSNYNHKTQLNTSREIFTILGLLVALLIPYVFGVSSDTYLTLNTLFYFFIIIFIPIFALTVYKIDIKTKVVENKFSFQQLKEVYAYIPQIKRLQLGYFINNLANALPATLFLYFVQLVLKEESYTGILLIIYFFSGVIALPIWLAISQKTNKKNTWLVSMCLASCSFFFVIFVQEGNIMAFVIISIISGFSLGADMALPSSIQSDIAQKVQNVHEGSFGILFGIWSMITKFSLAFAVAISFIILGLLGFDDKNPSENVLLAITLLYGLLPVVLKVITIVILLPFKETK